MKVKAVFLLCVILLSVGSGAVVYRASAASKPPLLTPKGKAKLGSARTRTRVQTRSAVTGDPAYWAGYFNGRAGVPGDSGFCSHQLAQMVGEEIRPGVVRVRVVDRLDSTNHHPNGAIFEHDGTPHPFRLDQIREVDGFHIREAVVSGIKAGVVSIEAKVDPSHHDVCMWESLLQVRNAQ